MADRPVHQPKSVPEASDLKYRDQQLMRLKDEILDLEDFNENVSLSEFTVDDFRMELAKYIENNRALLESAPLGLYAVVPPNPEFKQIAPGMIFCLKQLGDTTANETVNPLQPYFLVYVWNDGAVRYTFAQPRQILEIYRLLCSGKTAAYAVWCRRFDDQPRDGADMGAYSALLKKAVDSIAATLRKRSAAALLSSRGGVLPELARQALRQPISSW